MKQTQRQRVKEHLRAHGSITNVDAIGMKILRLSERIRELEADGMEIQHTREEHGVFRYTWLNRPEKRVPMLGPNGVATIPISRVEEAKAKGWVLT